MRKGQLDILVRREARGVLKLMPWVLGSVVIMLIIWQTGLAGASGLFQSPPAPTSPLPTATALPPTATQPPRATNTPLPAQTPTATVETVTPTELPTLSIESTALPTPTLTVTLTATVTATMTPTLTAEATATASPSPSPTAGTDEDEGDLAFDWAELFDALALGATYVWLCCGVLIFLSIPVVFAVLWVTYKRRQGTEDQA
jgi:hypothetical protein